ncbi:tyrosine-protein phosphatase non-receptor type 5 isoform X2 [Stigmatopora argus]
MRGAGGCLLLLPLVLCGSTSSQSASGQAGPRAVHPSDSDPRSHGGADDRRHHRHGDGKVPVEHAAVAARHLVTVFLASDVRRLNAALLRWFRGGVAAALGVPVGLIHINGLDEEKNGVEIFVSSRRADASEPRPALDVLRSLNVGLLRRHLAHLGITQVSVQKALRENAWGQEPFYTTVLFLAVFVVAVVCSTLLLGLKTTSGGHPKAPPPAYGGKADASHDEPAPTSTPTAPGPSAVPPPCPALLREADPAPSAAATPAMIELKPCPSPFRMKRPTGLQERRGSNVSLVLDVSTAVGGAVSTAGKDAAREYLAAARRPLTPRRLRLAVADTRALHDEFSEIPMNFTDAAQVDVPNHGSKNRYKSILPNPHSRVALRTGRNGDPLTSYINANYVRGYRGDQKAFIATQGPMANTVDDFWLMAWQEAAPAIVMITKLKEKNEKCVLYWPEKRGVFGQVEVEVDATRERQHYTARRVTLKRGDAHHTLRHFWFTAWPDHKTPSATVPLLRLMEDVEAARRAAPRAGPVVVHCSAGIGRTGCFIAASVGAEQLASEGAVDVLAITCQMRLDRGGMIQTAQQYEFVHRALAALQDGL